MMNLFDKELLESALISEYEIVATWGAYQILQLDKEEVKGFIPLFLDSSFSAIQDAGIAGIAELELKNHATDVLKIFRESEGQTKYSAAFALAQFPNDFSRSLIHKWFESHTKGDQSTRMEFEAATYAFLQIDRTVHFPLVLQALEHSQQDAIKSSVLFSYLLMFCENQSEFEEIIDQYFILRDLHSDAEITFQMIEHIGFLELNDWLAENISKGYSISSIFEQCCSLLNYDDDLTYRRFWSEIEEAYGDFDIIRPGAPKDFPRFMNSISKWVEYLLQIYGNRPALTGLVSVVNGFQRNIIQIGSTIPKILEMECHFILTIPIQIMMEMTISDWLKEPKNNLESIARYYNSSLLIKDYREEILWMFFPEEPTWTPDQVKIQKSHSPVSINDQKHEILWSFYREELLSYDIPWPIVFPNPEFSFNLSKGLFIIYFNNFDYYIEKKDRVAIDYALQLFQLHSEKKVIQLLLKHFDYLSDHHNETLYQAIERLPDPLFLDRLISKYQKEEYELTKLIFLICEIFNLAVPKKIDNDLNKLKESEFRGTGIKKPVSLNCKKCDSTFQYPVDLVYLDEGAILRMNKLSPESVWIPQEFYCKKCGTKVPFILDEIQLNEFSLQSRVDRLLKLTPQTIRSQFDHKVVLIDFPRHDAITYTPQAFENLIADYEKSSNADDHQMIVLRIKQAKMYKAMRNWQSCLKALTKIKSKPAELEIEWYFLMGLANYKLANYAESRGQFDHLVKNLKDNVEESTNQTLLDQSKYFLKILDSADSKRARFKVISGKQ